ncbi:RING finger protein 141 [Galendromus occidentalis]|uniref:RING finger protein 141 n=1 Tax=Galendromus occidentalis TaxID=34638 RepID=A0AAJ6VW88_9ACAR|nr:RING finger protein 141 [Galendromus occidentalis]
MGAQQSIAVQRELKQLRDIALLDRDTVAKMIIDLNEAGLNLKGREVRVDVVGYTDDQILWRRGIRFTCRVKDLQSNEELIKEINLRQFITVYHNVMMSKQLSNVPLAPPPRSRNSSDPSTDDDLCCVCLDRLPQVSLPCAHSFCPNCIQEWQLRSNSCPLCREESSVDEQWLLEEAPDLTEMERELRITLANLLRS